MDCYRDMAFCMDSEICNTVSCPRHQENLPPKNEIFSPVCYSSFVYECDEFTRKISNVAIGKYKP